MENVSWLTLWYWLGQVFHGLIRNAIYSAYDDVDIEVTTSILPTNPVQLLKGWFGPL
jgi:hypothetical protein